MSVALGQSVRSSSTGILGPSGATLSLNAAPTNGASPAQNLRTVPVQVPIINLDSLLSSQRDAERVADELAAQSGAPPSNADASSNTSFDLASLLPSTPPLIGEFNGGSTRTLRVMNEVEFGVHVVGDILVGAPGSKNAVIGFTSSAFGFDDFTTQGMGSDVSGDINADTFTMTEPVPPASVPTAPGPTYTFNGGTVVYTEDLSETTAQDGAFMDGEIWYATYSYLEDITMEVPDAAVRRIKIAENNSPRPRDRLYFDYRFFNNVIGGIGDEHRYTIGFEKTFFEQLMSFDIRLPLAITLEQEQLVGAASVRGFEVGNTTFIYKALLTQTRRLATSAGVAAAIPTGASTRAVRSDGSQLLVIDNEAVHLLPFVGAVWQPQNERLFFQGFLQLEIDLNGKPVRSDVPGNGLEQIGVLNDSTLFFADVSAGYWLFPGRRPNAWIERAAWLTELHYSTTLQDADVVAVPAPSMLTVADLTNRFDVLNVTFGLFMDLGGGKSVTGGMSLPLRSGDDHQFDAEVSLLANWHF